MRALTERFMIILALCALFSLAVGCRRGGSGDTTPGPRTETGAPVSEETRAEFEETVRDFQQAKQGGLEAGECARIAGNFEDVSDQVEAGLPEALFNSGMVWDKCGEHAKAQRMFEKANTAAKAHSDGKATGFAPALVQLGVYAYRDDDQRRAKQFFDQAREADRRSTEAYTNLGYLRGEEAYQIHKRSGIKQAMGAYKEAQTELRRALAVNSDFMTAFAQMALLYLEISEDNAQMLDITELVCQQATSRAVQIKSDPLTVAPIHNIWGLALIRKGDVVRAVEQFDRARQLNPSFFEAHMNYGAVNLSFRGFRASEQAFRKAIEIRPDDYQAHLSLGAALRGQGNFEEAQATYQKASQLDGAAPGAFYNLGVLMQDYLLTSAGDMNGQIAMLGKAKQEYRQFLNKCKGRRDDCVRRRPGQDDMDMVQAAEKRIKSCDDTISGLREAQTLAAEAEALAGEAERMAAEAENQQPPPSPEGEGGEGAEGAEGGEGATPPEGDGGEGEAD